MAEAPIKWKIELLRGILSVPEDTSYMADYQSQDWNWFLDMKRDGYVEGEPSNCTTPALNVVSLYIPDPNCFIHVHITKSGKEFIYDYEARTTIRGFWKKYYLSIFKWILGVAGTVLGAYLIYKYSFKQ